MDLIQTVLDYAASALVPLLMALIGSALKTWKDTYSAKAALAAVVDALERAAAIGVEELVQGKARDAKAAAAGMAEYVRKAMPDTLGKLSPAAGTVEQMALAVLLQTLHARQDARDAALPGAA